MSQYFPGGQNGLCGSGKLQNRKKGSSDPARFSSQSIVRSAIQVLDHSSSGTAVRQACGAVTPSLSRPFDGPTLRAISGSCRARQTA